MTRNRLIATASAVALLGSAGVATAAEAPVVSAQKTLSGSKAPVTVPGTGVKKGERLPKGARIVFRDVTLQGTQQVRLTLKAPAGKKLRGLAVRENDKVGFVVVHKGSYVGQAKVQVRAYAAPKTEDEATGRIYALVR